MKNKQVYFLDSGAYSFFKPSMLAGVSGERNVIAWLIYCHAPHSPASPVEN